MPTAWTPPRCWLSSGRSAGSVDRLLVVGCEPADIEDGMGLSEPVAGAVEEACRVVRDLIDKEVSRLYTRKETLA